MKHLLLLLSLLIISSLHAEQISFWQIQKVKSNDTLNIRQTATHKANKIAEIAYNEQCVKNHGCGKDIDLDSMMDMTEEEARAFLAQAKAGWCYVESQGKMGWVNKTYLKVSQAECH